MEPAFKCARGKMYNMCCIVVVVALRPRRQEDIKKMRGSVVARGCLWDMVVMGRKLVVHDNGGG